MNQPCYIVFLCFGDEGFFYECAFALLSLSRLYRPEQLPAEEIWIYTDKPEWFERFNKCSLPLCYRKITGEEIVQWRGSIDYQYRTKIEVLKDFSDKKTGNILYFDTDIVITYPIDALLDNIANGRVYMHCKEGIINSRATPMLARLDSYLRKQPDTDANSKPLYDTAMWNSGVIGYNTGMSKLVDDVLKFTDSIYPRNHSIRVIEQFAFSVQFQKHGDILPALPYALHYWNLKEVRAIFASFFNHFKNRSWEELVLLSGAIQMFELMMEKTRFNDHRSVLQILLNSKWTPKKIDWDQAEAQL